MQRRIVLTILGLVAIAGAVLSWPASVAAQSDLIAEPPADWTLFTNESGPIAQWPGFESLIEELGESGRSASGELRAWQSPAGEVIVTILLDTSGPGSGGFVEGFLDGARHSGLTDDCDIAAQLNVTFRCGLTDGRDATLAAWESDGLAVSISSFDVSSTATNQMVRDQLALVPASQPSSSPSPLPRLLGQGFAYVLMGAGVIWGIKKLSDRSSGKTIVIGSPTAPPPAPLMSSSARPAHPAPSLTTPRQVSPPTPPPVPQVRSAGFAPPTPGPSAPASRAVDEPVAASPTEDDPPFTF